MVVSLSGLDRRAGRPGTRTLFWLQLASNRLTVFLLAHPLSSIRAMKSSFASHNLIHPPTVPHPPYLLFLFALVAFYTSSSPHWTATDLTSHSNITPPILPLPPTRKFTHLRSPTLSLIPHPAYSTPLCLTHCFPVSSLMLLLFTLSFSLGSRIHVSLAHAFLPFLIFSCRLFFVVRACTLVCRLFVIDQLCI